MERLTISCDSCERLWTLDCALSIYEQQSLEARPCPHCGAYTLTVHEASLRVNPGGTLRDQPGGSQKQVRKAFAS
jgi:uncharacterized protein CbrC (UPF0167 family)